MKMDKELDKEIAKLCKKYKAPSYLTDADHWFVQGKPEMQNQCSCTMDVIMCKGCQCGGE
jgi:hypothetical protein